MIDRLCITIPAFSWEPRRRVTVWLPEGANEPDARFPVLYMFDGQNLFFDEDAAFGASWRLAETLEFLHTPLIVVGIDSSTVGDARLMEYSPYSHETGELGHVHGLGRTTLAWLCDTLKPLIDARYPTLPERESTFVGGSSMGGLMSLYAVTHRNDVFCAAVSLSPSLWTHPEKAKHMLRTGHFAPHTLIYMDYGAAEMGNHEATFGALLSASEILLHRDCDLTFRIVPGGAHCEASWADRVPVFLRCLGF